MLVSFKADGHHGMVGDEQGELLLPNWLGQSDEEVLGKLLGSTSGVGSAPELDSD